MLKLVTPSQAHSTTARSHCPDCAGDLAVLRVIPGRAKAESKSESRAEYWTMRCTKCGGIHLDILKAVAGPVERHAESGAEASPAANL
jgi:uncharacterized Zn finger protein